MDTAIAASRRSLCDRAQVGCVIVTFDNRVVSVSYSGPSPAFAHHGQTCQHWCERFQSGSKEPAYPLSCSTHAEIAALVRADWSMLNKASLYVNGSVCRDCARAIATSPIRRVVHIVDDTMEHRSPDEVESFLRQRSIWVERYGST